MEDESSVESRAEMEGRASGDRGRGEGAASILPAEPHLSCARDDSAGGTPPARCQITLKRLRPELCAAGIRFLAAARFGIVPA